MDFEVEKGIAIPPKGGKELSSLTRALKALEIGDCIKCNTKAEANNITSRVHYINKREGRNIKITQRRCFTKYGKRDNIQRFFYRIWRIE